MIEQERILQSWFGNRLNIQSLYERQGERLVFSAESESGECRVFLSQNQEIREKLWRGIIPRREKIRHRYLAPVIDFGRLPSGDHYWCFSLGKTFSSLERSFAQWPQNPLHLIRLVLQTAQGVVALHRRSVVHGDIRPRNIGVQISDMGAEEVLLFGSMMVFLPKEGYWPENVLKDQALTQAPEIVSGEKIPTYASDVYSLGVLLFRSVFGSWPFQANSSFEISAKHVTETLRCPKIKPSISPDLWEVIAQAMDKNPDNRMSCKELVDRISPFADYEQAIFGDLELTDPSLIERPSSHLQSSRILPLQEDLLEEEEEEMFWELEEQDFEVLSFLDKEEPEEEAVIEPEIESEESLEKIEPVPETETELQNTVEYEVALEERTEKISSIPISIPAEEDELEPLQVLVGARPMPSSQDLEQEVTAKIDLTNKLPVFWDDPSNSSQEVTIQEAVSIEATEKTEKEISFRDSTVEVLVEHEETTIPGLIISPKMAKPAGVIAKEITDGLNASRNSAKKSSKKDSTNVGSSQLSKFHFGIFLMLSTIITVLILKILEQIF